MKRCLWNEAVWKGDAEETSDTGCQTEEKNIPMETSGFAKGKLCALSDQGGDYSGVLVSCLGRKGDDEPLWSNQNRIVNKTAKGIARKTSPTLTSQK